MDFKPNLDDKISVPEKPNETSPLDRFTRPEPINPKESDLLERFEVPEWLSKDSDEDSRAENIFTDEMNPIIFRDPPPVGEIEILDGDELETEILAKPIELDLDSDVQVKAERPEWLKDEPDGRVYLHENNLDPLIFREAPTVSETEISDSDVQDTAEQDGTSETTDEPEITSIKCLNEDLAGKEHPITGVVFVEKIVENENGEKVKVVVPVFDSVFDAQLPEEKLQSSDYQQFKECNQQLKEAVEKDPELAKKFTPEQLEQIKNGDTPDGYTWHHHEETGKMQLVETSTHDKTAHTGGKAIWGGGR